MVESDLAGCINGSGRDVVLESTFLKCGRSVLPVEGPEKFLLPHSIRIRSCGVNLNVNRPKMRKGRCVIESGVQLGVR